MPKTSTTCWRKLRTLNPRPCGTIGAEEPQTLVPDILLKRTDWGGHVVELNPDTLPKVLVDRDYRAVLEAEGSDQAQGFLAECHSSASWLVKSLDQRARTILRVATEIIRQQERFFSEGVAGLRPLTLREVADSIDMHESTVSRVTSNKYIATDRGILELKFFFTNALGGAEGGPPRLRRFATGFRRWSRPRRRPVCFRTTRSSARCAPKAFDIARRTVAKYRKSLNIPSSVERRRQLAIAGAR